MNKIGLIIHSLGIGGMERVMHQLILDFSLREHIELHLFLIGIKREIRYQIPESVFVHKPEFQFNNTRRTIDTIRTIRFLRKKIKEINPDSVLSFGEYWNNLVLFSLYGLSYPVFISDRSEPDKDLGKVQNFLRSQLYPKAAGYIAQTEEAKNVCLKNGWNNNVIVIGNPIREIRSNGEIKKENIVLSVGRLIKTKHFDQLIEMFLDIAHPDWKLVIVGGDAKKMHLSKDLGELIHKLGAERYVSLEGEQKDIDSYYNKSKIFAFTSSSEGFPNVIGEAMSSGLPVVSYDCVAGPSDLITDSNSGCLVPLFDEEKFKQKLNQLMVNKELRTKMGEKAKKDIQKFTAERIAEQFYTFITSKNRDQG